MWHKPIDIRIIYPYIYLKNKRVSAVVIVLVCLGGVACIKTLSTSSVGLPQLAFDNIEALASGESSAYRCYGIGDVDCHGDKVDKMYSGYSLK